MTTKTVTIGKDGSLVITKSDDGPPPLPPSPPGAGTGVATMTGRDGAPLHRDHPMPGEVLFLFGMMAGALLLWLIQRGNRAKACRAADRPAADRFGTDVDALARRTATLERIVTDRSARVADEIDALR